MKSELSTHDLEEHPYPYMDNNILISRTAIQIFRELEICLELIRDSLRDIIKEIKNFNKEELPVVKKIYCGELNAKNERNQLFVVVLFNWIIH